MPSRRLLVVSHPSVVPANQSVYVSLLEDGWDVQLVVPAHWRHEYHPGSFAPRALPELEHRLVPMRVALAGRPQRHFYLARPRRVLQSFRPDVAFLEQEPFAVTALQWGSALTRSGTPYGVQADENMDRRLPWPARWIRARVFRDVGFIAARSPAARDLMRVWGMSGRVEVVPHAVPDWPVEPCSDGRRFTVGYAGRLVEEKGIRDLVDASRLMQRPCRLLFVGDGPLRTWLQGLRGSDVQIDVNTDISHEDMPRAYAQMDVLVLPSRSTPTWTEQFGRSLAEALWCGVPVVGAESGEIPWVIRTTGGGRTFPEGDAAALAGILDDLHDNPSLRASLGRTGSAEVRRTFSVKATARILSELLSAAQSR